MRKSEPNGDYTTARITTRLWRLANSIRKPGESIGSVLERQFKLGGRKK